MDKLSKRFAQNTVESIQEHTKCRTMSKTVCTYSALVPALCEKVAWVGDFDGHKAFEANLAV